MKLTKFELVVIAVTLCLAVTVVTLSFSGKVPELLGETKLESSGQADYRININYASADTLRVLPGVGEKTAENIIKYRRVHDGFDTIEEILNVPGIGEKKFEKIKDLITVD